MNSTDGSSVYYNIFYIIMWDEEYTKFMCVYIMRNLSILDFFVSKYAKNAC